MGSKLASHQPATRGQARNAPFGAAAGGVGRGRGKLNTRASQIGQAFTSYEKGTGSGGGGALYFTKDD